MNIPLLISLLITVFTYLAAAGLTLESYLLYKNKNPITWYSRNLISNQVHLAFIVEAVLVFAGTFGLVHFFIDK